jgi:predicted NBD/HSP70 family sugar kinase
VGLDLGDRTSRYCILDEAGEKVSEHKLPTTKPGLEAVFEEITEIAKRYPEVELLTEVWGVGT